MAARCSSVGKSVGFIMTVMVPLAHEAPLVLANRAGVAHGTSKARAKLPKQNIRTIEAIETGKEQDSFMINTYRT